VICTNCGREGHELSSCFKLSTIINGGHGNGKNTRKGKGNATDSIIGCDNGKVPIAHLPPPSSTSSFFTSQDISIGGPHRSKFG